jgi:hypothetical protein
MSELLSLIGLAYWLPDEVCFTKPSAPRTEGPLGLRPPPALIPRARGPGDQGGLVEECTSALIHLP